MPIDAFFLTALAGELDETIRGARVDKIHQPSDSEVLMAMRGPTGSFRLLIVAGGGTPRVHLTEVSRENPSAAPMFCMLLRKYLTSARVKAVRQIPMERILEIDWDTQDEMGIPSVKKLVIELMGRNSNIALVAEDGRVLDCLRRGGLDSPRPIQAGLFYRAPDAPAKSNPLSVMPGEFARMWQARQGTDRPEDFLMNTFTGVSPVLAREIALEPDALDKRFFAHIDAIRKIKFAPYILRELNGTPKEFYYSPLAQYGALYDVQQFDGTFSQLLDAVCGEKERTVQLGQRVSDLRKMAKNGLTRVEKKIGLQEQTLSESRDRERFRRFGDLLMANVHKSDETRGKKYIEVEDFYGDTGDTARIPLDETKSLQQNAAQYYSKYRKLKNAESMVTEQLAAARAELAYWESVLEELSRVTSQKDIDEIREELVPEKRASAKVQKKPKALKAQSYISSEGIPFRAGRNNRQNDELTMRQASKNDIWLHVQKLPGCHVVIDTSGGVPGDQTLLEAATVAAVYSQGADSPKTTVDYTQIKHVKKPPGAKPGMVIYHEFKTIIVKPDRSLAESLKES